MAIEAIVIGASAGGFSTISSIIPKIVKAVNIPIMLVQHISASSENFIIPYLNEQSSLNIKEIDEKECITSGNIYFAPPNYHVLIEKDKTFSLSVEERVSYSRPSIEVLFESEAEVYRERLLGIILTGANSDGTLGASRIKHFGGTVITQDLSDAKVKEMPKSVIENVEVNYILTAREIIEFVNKLHK